MGQRPGQVLFDAAFRDRQPASDLPVTEPFKARHKEGAAGLFGQFVDQQLEDTDQQIPGRGDLRRAPVVLGFQQGGDLAQGFLLHLFAVVAVDQQAAGNDQKISARLAQCFQGLIAENQAQKSIVAEIRGVLGAAQAPVQPMGQPAMMSLIQSADLALGARRQGLWGCGCPGHAFRYCAFELRVIIN